jgi:uncharacterized protein (TIGR01777 family)
LGRRLAADLLGRGHEVVVLTRRVREAPHRQLEWDGRTVGPWAKELAGSAVVNLAGAIVDRRPTPANVELLTRSRVEPTRALVAATRALPEPVPVLVQMSTLAIYGDAGEQVLAEDAPPAAGPPQMAGVARAWEAAVDGAAADRVAVLRTAVVLDNGTPALDRLLGLARWGLGGRIGSGRQWFSWLHGDDWLAVLREVLEPTAAPLAGVVHVTSPNPVRNAELMAALRAVTHRPPAPPTPAPLLRAGALLLRTDPALALTGRRAVPARLQAQGFTFTHPDLPGALAHLAARGA